MEKNLKQILSEMKKLMEYNPSIGKIISEQDPDFDIDPRLGSQKSDRLGKGGTFDKQQKELTRKGVKSTDGYFYRQSFNEHKGYFDNNMMLGECFDIINFTTNDNALTSMNIPKDKMFKDEIGYYIKGKTNAYGDSRDIRIYLPKDDFFRNLNGVVKSFIAYQTCNDQKRKQGGRKYNLVYQLTDPSKAVINQIIDGNGFQIIDGEVSRGWTISQFGGNQSGYFRSKSEEYDDVIGGDPSLKGSLLPQDFSEFSLDNYGEEYGRSDFDIWYDSNWGTAVSIGVAILASIVTAGIAGAIGITSRVAILGAELAGELLIAIPEAIYLKGRGLNSSAAMVLIFSLIPVLNASGFAKKLTGSLTDKEIKNLIKQVKDKAPNFKTPGDVKDWIKGLDDKTRKFVEETLQYGSDALKQVNKEALVKDIESGLKKIANEKISSKVVINELQENADKLFMDYAKNYGSTFKLIGLDLVAVFSSMPIIKTLVKDDEEIMKDPQGFLENVKKNIELVFGNTDEKIRKKAEEECKKLQSDFINATTTDEQLEKGKLYLNFLRDIGNTGKIDYEEMSTEAYKVLLQMVLYDIKKEYYVAYANNQTKEILESKNKYNQLVNTTEKFEQSLLSFCSDLPMTPFQNYQEACEFLTWVSTNKKNFYFTISFEDGTEMTVMGVKSCDFKKNELGYSESFIMNECEIRNAYSQYGTEYSKIVPTTIPSSQVSEVKDWQYKDSDGNWIDCTNTQAAARKKKGQEIREKPKMN
jgi:hypothetical protein